MSSFSTKVFSINQTKALHAKHTRVSVTVGVSANDSALKEPDILKSHLFSDCCSAGKLQLKLKNQCVDLVPVKKNYGYLLLPIAIVTFSQYKCAIVHIWKTVFSFKFKSDIQQNKK